ncbi:uncharacterized protein [Globicephala melas]|uniref:uncharacterized protein isoform X2 n=1 Tax=Globicephala melas TaxID=9731 RepID=UPI00293D9442|nr:uncharacterized protein LOC115866801 isoform X2 [Globicephala melas]
MSKTNSRNMSHSPEVKSSPRAARPAKLSGAKAGGRPQLHCVASPRTRGPQRRKDQEKRAGNSFLLGMVTASRTQSTCHDFPDGKVLEASSLKCSPELTSTCQQAVFLLEPLEVSISGSVPASRGCLPSSAQRPLHLHTFQDFSTRTRSQVSSESARDLQDGGGVRRGDHLPAHKYIRITSTWGTTPAEHLLNAGRRPQTFQKARNSPRTR